MIATVESGLLTVDLRPDRRRQPGRLHDSSVMHARPAGDPRWWEALQLRYEDGTAARAWCGGDTRSPRSCVHGEAVRDVKVLITRPQGTSSSSRPTTSRSPTVPMIQGMYSRSPT